MRAAPHRMKLSSKETFLETKQSNISALNWQKAPQIKSNFESGDEQTVSSCVLCWWIIVWIKAEGTNWVHLPFLSRLFSLMVGCEVTALLYQPQAFGGKITPSFTFVTFSFLFFFSLNFDFVNCLVESCGSKALGASRDSSMRSRIKFLPPWVPSGK